MASLLKTGITAVGQPFVDDPVYARPKAMSYHVAAAVGGHLPGIIGHERVRLNWIKPRRKIVNALKAKRRSDAI